MVDIALRLQKVINSIDELQEHSFDNNEDCFLLWILLLRKTKEGKRVLDFLYGNVKSGTFTRESVLRNKLILEKVGEILNVGKTTYAQTSILLRTNITRENTKLYDQYQFLIEFREIFETQFEFYYTQRVQQPT